jgi:hypothetical protein
MVVMHESEMILNIVNIISKIILVIKNNEEIKLLLKALKKLKLKSLKVMDFLELYEKVIFELLMPFLYLKLVLSLNNRFMLKIF